MEKNKSTSLRAVFALALFSGLWSVLSVVLMLSYRERGDYGYTGAADYTVRMILILLCAVLFLWALLCIMRCCLKGGDGFRAVAAAYKRLGFGLLCAIVVEGISLYREFQNSAKLLEDAVFLFMTIAAAIALLIGIAGADSRKRLLVSGILASAFLAFAVLLGFTVFRENTNRTLNFMYFAHRIGYLFPFVTAAAAAGVLPRAETAGALSEEAPPEA